jgi:hypothetical protein
MMIKDNNKVLNKELLIDKFYFLLYFLNSC